MAKGWTKERANGWLACWRDTNGKERSKLFPTQDEARAHAERMAVDGSTRARMNPGFDTLDAFQAGARWSDKAGAWLNPDGSEYVPSGQVALDPEFAFAAYLRRAIERQVTRPSTKELYERNIRLHIDTYPRLAKADIRFVDHVLLEDFWHEHPISPGVRSNVYQLLAKAFNRAVKRGDIPASPLVRTDEVKRPKKGTHVKRKAKKLTVAQVKRLADHARSKRDRMEILAMAWAGLRAGEVGGLRIQDIEFQYDEDQECERAHLDIQQQVARVTGVGQYIEDPKSDAGTRTVVLPCSVSAELKEFLEENEPASDGRVFYGANGALRAHNAVLHTVKLAAKDGDVRDSTGKLVNSHQLRHFAGSILIDGGANPKEVQRFMGHKTIATTMDIYVDEFDKSKTRMADIMERQRNGGRS